MVAISGHSAARASRSDALFQQSWMCRAQESTDSKGDDGLPFRGSGCHTRAEPAFASCGGMFCPRLLATG